MTRGTRRLKRADEAEKAPEISFPVWVPRPVAERGLKLMRIADDEEERELLRRLSTDPRMKRVWAELYKKMGSGPDPRPYANRAFIWPETRAAAAADVRTEKNQARIQQALKFADQVGYLRKIEPGASEQDDAAVLFFERAYVSGLGEPSTESERQQFVRDYRELAKDARLKASHLSGAKAKAELELANIYDDHVEYYQSSEVADEPTIIRRVRGDIRERSLVRNLLMVTNSIFRKNLSNTIGTVVAVILNSEKISRDRVNAVLRFSR